MEKEEIKRVVDAWLNGWFNSCDEEHARLASADLVKQIERLIDAA